MHVSWARHADEVREAQRLRYRVFAVELGADVDSPLPGHDVDRFDDHCEHLLVRDSSEGSVIGTYRLLLPAQAAHAGSYSEQAFDLRALAGLRPRMAELGRSCVHPDHRQGAVMLALWGALAQVFDIHEVDSVIGCASIGAGALAAGVWNGLRRTHLAPPRYRVTPREPLPLDGTAGQFAAAPPLLRGYLRLGARVLGPPAWDSSFQCADLPVMVHTADLPARYRPGAARS